MKHPAPHGSQCWIVAPLCDALFWLLSGFNAGARFSLAITRPCEAESNFTILQTEMMIPFPVRQVVALFVTTLILNGAAFCAEAPPKDGSIVIVLDNSKASREVFRNMRLAVRTFIRSLDEEDEVALVTAGGSPVLVQDFTSDEAALEKQLQKLKTTDGALDLSQAIAFASNHAVQNASNSSPAVIVFASGIEAERPVAPPRAAGTSVAKPVPVYVIASPKADWKAQQEFQQLASNSGGAAFFPSSNSEWRDVVRETAVRVAGPPPDPKEEGRRPRGLLKSYDTVLVRNIPVIENEKTTEVEGGENILLQEVLVSRLRKAEVFPQVVDAKEMPPSSTNTAGAQSNGTAELLASILEYRRGNRTQRQMLGWKGGAKFKVRVILVDATTRQPILSFTEEGSHSSGLLGGSQEHVQARAMLDVANEIVKELKRAKFSKSKDDNHEEQNPVQASE